MARRILVMGDNHGNTESLRRVLDDTEGETFDVAVHVGDFTKAWREESKERGAEELRAVEPLLAEIDSRARHGLVWVYGNQDYFGDLDHDLDVGTEIPDDGRVTVGDLRFTNSPAHVESDVVLVTHMEKWSLLDQFDGLAHFCGNTHRGRRLDRRLNSAFLHVADPETGAETYGGYFVVALDGRTFDVEMRSVGSLERVECDVHGERGVQFQPAFRDCMYCSDERVLMREMAATAFYGLTHDSPRDAVPAADLVDYAASLWEDPPDGFREDFEAYLAAPAEDRYAPLALDDDGRLVVAERSYAY